MGLALAMIVKNEEHNIVRCLESCYKIFDQIVVVDTGSTDKTREVVREFGKKNNIVEKLDIGEFRWIDDFSAARNFSFEIVNQDWVMWLDADDIIKNSEAIRKYFDQNCNSCEAMLLPWDYAHDDNGNVLLTLYRERIIKTEKAKWEYPIHECINSLNLKIIKCEDKKCSVSHMRRSDDYVKNIGRNLRILELHYEKYKEDHRYIYYYANELRDNGKYREAINMYEKLGRLFGFMEEKYNAYISIAQCLDKLQEQKKIVKDSKEIIRYLEKARNLFPSFFEANYLLALNYKDVDVRSSIYYFEICKNNQFSVRLLADRKDISKKKIYEELEILYSKIGDFEKTLECCEELLKFYTGLNSLLHDKQFCRDRITEKFEKMVDWNKPVCLNLGAGGQKFEGYYSCDRYDENADLKFDMSFIPFRNKTISAIYSEHSLEHLTSENSVRCIAECARVLKPGGYLTLEIPDFEESSIQYIGSTRRKSAPEIQWYQATIWGRQYTNGNVDLGQFHSTGFTRQFIKKILEINGFCVVSMHTSNKYGTPSIEISAVKRIVVGYHDFGDINNASSRLRRIPLYSNVRKDVPVLVRKINKDLCDEDVVVYTSFDSATLEEMKSIKGKVLRIVDYNEAIFFHTLVQLVLKEADLIICCSNKLKEMTEKIVGLGKCVVLEDSYEATINEVMV